jgi:hypothetical protein
LVNNISVLASAKASSSQSRELKPGFPPGGLCKIEIPTETLMVEKQFHVNQQHSNKL